MSYPLTQPVPHLMPLKRWQVIYRCAHGSNEQHRVVLRAATEQGAQAWAAILLAGEVISIKPLTSRTSIAAQATTTASAAAATLAAIGQVLLSTGA